MARINPDPYAGVQAFALVNRVTGLVDSEEEAMATVRALEEGGVAQDDIDVFVGEEGARRLDLSGREHGRIVRWMRRLEAAVGDESEPNRRIDEGLRRGGSLVCVKVHRRHGDEKPRAFRILEARHGHEIHFWGAWGFEDAPASGTCVFCKLPPERILGENEFAVWIFDAHPVSPGHSLIIPKRHVESIFDATPMERDAMLSLLDRARDRVRQNQAPSGYNIGFNEGSAAGETTHHHLHIHLIPRYAGEKGHTKGGLGWMFPEKVYPWSQ
jgi:diadenosine tetraphosphate (Ap4A) HIT family hydrolase